MTLEEAEEVFDKFFKNKPRVKEFIDETHEKVYRDGYIECLHGFRRSLRDVYSHDKSTQNEAYRQSVNTMIQGSGAFLTNSSVIHIQNFIERSNLRSKLIMTVHDSVVVDCPPEEVNTMAYAVKYIMEHLPIDWLMIDPVKWGLTEWGTEKMRYPIKADIDIGKNYNDLVGYDKEDYNSFNKNVNYFKYYTSLDKIEDYYNSGLITEDKYKSMTEYIESQKEVYQKA